MYSTYMDWKVGPAQDLGFPWGDHNSVCSWGEQKKGSSVCQLDDSLKEVRTGRFPRVSSSLERGDREGQFREREMPVLVIEKQSHWCSSALSRLRNAAGDLI